MDKRTETTSKVEYVEAEPIGVEAPPALQPMPYVHTQYQTSSGCVPCCGPIGCATLLMVLLWTLGSSSLTRPLVYALGIFLLVSVVGGMFSRRRRG